MGWKRGTCRIRRTVACVTAMAAVVLGAICTHPAYAAGEQTNDVVSVAVPTEVSCALMPDGRVVVPSGLAIQNKGGDDEFLVDAYTEDDNGHKVDFTLDLGGKRVLTRSDGRDAVDYAVLPAASSTGMSLSVSKLTRQSNAALMDAAAMGEADMFRLGFKFNLRELQGMVSISGDTLVGSTLTATASGMQDDAKPSYQWYRDGVKIAGAVGKTYKTTDADAGHDITCKVTDTSGRYTGTLTSNAIRPVKPVPKAFAVYSADDNSLNFYKRETVPDIGSQFDGRTVTNIYKNVESSNRDSWSSICSATKRVRVIDEIHPVHMGWWFKDFSNLTAIDGLSKIDTSKVTEMRMLFDGCKNLSTLDLSNFNTSNVTDMQRMFNGCSSLTTLDVSAFDTSKVTTMAYMFFGTGISEIDLSNFNTSNVTDMHGMFESSKFKSLDLTSFDTSNVTTMAMMFQYMTDLTTLDISSFDMVNVTEMASIFNSTSRLGTIKVGSGFRLVNTSFPYASNVPGHDLFDPKWYNSSGHGFALSEIPSNIADTYTAWDPNLHGSVNITGDMQNGLKAKVSGVQSDAKLAFEWHRKGTVTDSFTWDIPMLTPSQRTITVGENAYIEVSMMDSNQPRNGYTIVVTGNSGEVYRQTFTKLGTVTIQIPPSGYLFRIENHDPMEHTAYVRITSDKDSPIAGAASDSIGVSEAGDYYCVVTDKSGKYKGQLVSNTLTVR